MDAGDDVYLCIAADRAPGAAARRPAPTRGSLRVDRYAWARVNVTAQSYND